MLIRANTKLEVLVGDFFFKHFWLVGSPDYKCPAIIYLFVINTDAGTSESGTTNFHKICPGQLPQQPCSVQPLRKDAHCVSEPHPTLILSLAN